MKPIHAILALYAVQMAFFAAIWLAMARMRLSRRATLHWGLGSAVLTLGMAAVLARDWMPEALGKALPNIVHLGAALLVARGVRLFVRRRQDDRWLLGAVAVAAAVVALANALGAPHAWTVVAAGLGMGVTLLRAAHDIRSGLSTEFGRLPAWLCSLPMWVIGALLLGRALAALAGAGGAGRPLSTGDALQVAMALALVLMAMTMHLAMGGMLMLRMIQRLRHLSQHDALTGALNRRAFAQRLEAERARRQRQPAPLALLALDLDHFKSVNDRWGHAGGDAVLAATAALLKREARSVDAVARMGGEEFALLLPGTDLDGAHRLAERVLQALRDMTIAVDGQTLRVTASIGAAVAADAGEDAEELLRRADRALYLAKAGGRDRVVCAGALSAVPVAGEAVSPTSTPSPASPPRRAA